MHNFVMKVVKVLLFFFVTLPFTLYFFLLVVNSTDEEKSEQVLAFEHFLELRKQIDERENAYVSLVGITAKADEDIYLIGQNRIALLRNHAITNPELPFVDTFDVNDFRTQLENIFSACQTAFSLNEKCQQHLLRQQDKITTLLNKNQLLLQRYRRLTKLTKWHETISLNTVYQSTLLLSLQQLNMLSSWQRAMSDKPEGITLLVEQQGLFVTNFFSSTHLLSTKMIASLAVKRHYNWAFFILSNMTESPSKQALNSSLVDAFSIPFSQQSLSLKHVFIGEWQFSQRNFIEMWQDENNNDWLNFFFQPLFQQQATANLSAKYFHEALKKPLKSDTEASNACPDLLEGAWQTLAWYSYNPMGKLLVCSSVIDFSYYQEKLNGIEFLRKNVLAKLIR